MPRRSTNSESGHNPLVVRSVVSIGSIGISIGGMMLTPPQPTRAQVDPGAAKAKPNLQAVPVESVFEAPPEPSYVDKAPIVEDEYWAPEPEYIEPEYIEPEYIEPEYVEPPYIEEPREGSHSYIDTTDYSLGATTVYDEAPAVVLSERSTGCEATVEAGEGVPGSVCVWAEPSKPVTAATAAPAYPGEPVALPNVVVPNAAISNAPVPGLEVPTPPVAATNAGVEYAAAVVPNYYPVADISAIDLGEIDLSAIALGVNGFMPKPGEDSAQIYNSYYNVAAQALRDRSIRPQDLVAQVSSRLVFPLSIPAPITSAFGWRIHPVLGTARMHTGTDIGAPMGTPVVAALAGRVAISDFLGGYGLAVVIEHEKGTTETLYGHLSEVFVRAGETVKKGDPIGRVGSTGLSTGPHLHFEVRKMTKEGWVNLDPGRQLEYGLAQLVRNLRMTENAPANPPTVLDAQTAESELDDISQGETSEETVAEVPSSW